MIAAALAVALLQAPGGPGVRLATGVAPDTVTVGDRFRSLARLRVPPSVQVTFERLATTDTLQQTDSVRVVRDSAGVTAAYTLVAWAAGALPGSTVVARLVEPGGRATRYRIPLRLPHVASVLPEDTVGLKPKPAKGVVSLPRPAERDRLLLLALALLAALGVLYWLWRRRRRGGAAEWRDPREVALERLDALVRDAPPADAEVAAFYTAVVRVVREYLAARDPRWGEHRTSVELVRALRSSEVAADRVRGLAVLLDEADPVRFSGSRRPGTDPAGFAARTRAWVADFEDRDAPAGVEAAA